MVNPDLYAAVPRAEPVEPIANEPVAGAFR